MPTFMRYSMVAAKEALEDASWLPLSAAEQDMTVQTPSVSDRDTQY